MAKVQTHRRQCLQCNSEFFSRFYYAKYCSTECKHKFWDKNRPKRDTYTARKQYYKNYYEKNKRAILDKNEVYNKEARRIRYEITDRLKSVPCNHCGKTFPPCAMDFHHVGDKEQLISSMVRQNCKIDKLEKEIAKCVVLCANCHRIHHYNTGT